MNLFGSGIPIIFKAVEGKQRPRSGIAFDPALFALVRRPLQASLEVP